MSKRIPVIIDCDPGCDDAAALLLAFRSPELDVRGITTVSGNVPLEKTTRNALRLCEVIGTDVPVSAGASKPMFCEAIYATHVHGEDGLQGAPLPEPQKQVTGLHAWDAIYREAVAMDGELQIIAVGPLTNLGIALAKYNDLAKRIRRIVIMGGAAVGGNVTPCAEFNIYVDPEAADIVFKSGIPMVVCGLDVTLKAYLTAEEIREIGALGTPQAKLFETLTATNCEKRFCPAGAPLHDPAAVLCAADDSIFTTQRCWMRVETSGTITRGKTVTDCYSDAQKEANITLVLDVDREKFAARVKELLARY
jgi:pyrimidine-specific ribonucleoside hydrolase